MQELKSARLEICAMLNQCQSCNLPLLHRRPGQKKRNNQFCATHCSFYREIQPKRRSMERLQIQRRAQLGVPRTGTMEPDEERVFVLS